MPNRGEVRLADLGMVQKVRPALILNRPFRDTDRALISVIPHTTISRGSDLEIDRLCRNLMPHLKKAAPHYSAGAAVQADFKGCTVNHLMFTAPPSDFSERPSS